MGIGVSVVRLYRHLQHYGVLDGIYSVAELGAQVVVWPNDLRDLAALYLSFGKMLADPEYIENSTSGIAPAKSMYEALGFTEYACFDIDTRTGALSFDLNYDDVSEDYQGRYDLVTNCGTTEHVINQLNAFRVMHDLTREGGVMLHAVPLATGYWDHGFVAYCPNLFVALAKYNNYELIGMWISDGWDSQNIFAFSPEVHYELNYGPNAKHELLVLFRKRENKSFQPPLQLVYEGGASLDKKEKYIDPGT